MYRSRCFWPGLPFFTLALADPFTALVMSDVTYPGRRISVMIDASTQHADAVQGAASEPSRRDRRDVFHGRRGGRTVLASAHQRQVPRPRRARRVRQRGVRGDAVHERLRQHPAQHLAHRRSGRVFAVSRSGHDHRAGDRSERRTVQGVQLSRRVGKSDGALHRRRGHARDRQRTNASTRSCSPRSTPRSPCTW